MLSIIIVLSSFKSISLDIDILRECNLELNRQLQGRVSIGKFVTLPLFC